MRAILEVLLSLLAVFGLLSLGWLAFGRLLSPAGGEGCCVVIPTRGRGDGLEQAVTGMLWLRGGGLMNAPILLVDCGLNDEGRAVAAALCLREPGLGLCHISELSVYIKQLPEE